MEKTKPRLIGPFKVDEARSHLFKMNTTSAGGRTVAGLRIAINRYAATTAGFGIYMLRSVDRKVATTRSIGFAGFTD